MESLMGDYSNGEEEWKKKQPLKAADKSPDIQKK